MNCVYTYNLPQTHNNPRGPPATMTNIMGFPAGVFPHLILFLISIVTVKADKVKTVKQNVGFENITLGPSYEHPIRTSSLMCYECANTRKTDNCVTMANTSEVLRLRCRKGETFCKVRRLKTEGELTTLDRKCSSGCTPGCNEGLIYQECISCCTNTLCNTDLNSGTCPRIQLRTTYLLYSLLIVRALYYVSVRNIK